LFLSGFICKIGYPLCLNFLQIAKINTYKTSLESFLGVMDLFPVFGNNFAIFYPSLLVIFIIFNIFEIFGKLSQIFGFGFFAGGGLKKVDCEEIIEDGLEVLNRCMCFFTFLLFYFFTFLLFLLLVKLKNEKERNEKNERFQECKIKKICNENNGNDTKLEII